MIQGVTPTDLLAIGVQPPPLLQQSRAKLAWTQQ